MTILYILERKERKKGESTERGEYIYRRVWQAFQMCRRSATHAFRCMSRMNAFFL